MFIDQSGECKTVSSDRSESVLSFAHKWTLIVSSLASMSISSLREVFAMMQVRFKLTGAMDFREC
jgi:hypothetical protein